MKLKKYDAYKLSQNPTIIIGDFNMRSNSAGYNEC